MTQTNPLNFGFHSSELNGSLYFNASFDGNGNELWKLGSSLSAQKHEMQQSIQVYPNPVNDMLHLTSQEAIKNIRIVDLSGKTVYESVYNLTEINVDVSYLQQTIYLMQITTENQTNTVKISKK